MVAKLECYPVWPYLESLFHTLHYHNQIDNVCAGKAEISSMSHDKGRAQPNFQYIFR